MGLVSVICHQSSVMTHHKLCLLTTVLIELSLQSRIAFTAYCLRRTQFSVTPHVDCLPCSSDSVLVISDDSSHCVCYLRSLLTSFQSHVALTVYRFFQPRFSSHITFIIYHLYQPCFSYQIVFVVHRLYRPCFSYTLHLLFTTFTGPDSLVICSFWFTRPGTNGCITVYHHLLQTSEMFWVHWF